MSENLLISTVSKKSGLSTEQVDPTNPLIATVQKKSGTTLSPASGRKYGFDGLDIAAGGVRLTNTYTDPLESYTSYGVPRNALIDWNETRAQNQTWYQQFGYGVTKAGITAVGALAENTVGVVGGLLNLAFGENHSYYDNPVGRTIDSVNEWSRENMPNYYTKAEERAGLLEGLGSMNFWADKFANGLGYTVGSMATMWLGVGEGAMLSKVGQIGRMSGIAKATDAAADAAAAAGKFGSKQFQAYNAAKVINGGGKNIAGSIDDGLTQMARRANIKTASKHLSVGLHMSLAEASVEAREAKNRFIEDQKAIWEEANPGQEMPADVEEGIVASGAAAGNVTFGINLPILAATNVIMFRNMFKTGKPTSESLTYNIKKVDGKWVDSLPDKGLARAFGKANRMFGAPLKNSATEAFQEGAQFTASELSRDYYSDKFADGVGDIAESFNKALANTIGSKEGLESMLIGALVGGGTGTVSRLAGADKKFAQEKSANTKKALDILNSESFAKVLENMESTGMNLSLVKDMNEAVAAGEFVEAEKLRRRIISNTANHYRKSGALDYAMEQMDDLKQLDETEFKKRWGYDANRTLKEQTGMEQSQIIDDVKSKMQRSIKRQEQVESILRAQQPPAGAFARILDSFETKEIRESKALEQNLRKMYANQLLYRLEHVDAIDDLIKDKYQELLEQAPALSQLSEEDFEYMVKTGKIEVDDKGDVKLSPLVKAEKTDKLTTKLNEIFANKKALNPADSEQFEKTVKGLDTLIMDRQAAIQSYQGLRNNPENLGLLVEAEVAKRKLDDSYKKQQQAQAAIENSQSTEELDLALPKGVSDENLAKAKIKRRQLEEEEDTIARGYEKLTDDEFNAIDEETLTPAEEVAYRRVKRQKDIRDAANSKNIQSDLPPIQPADISYDEVLSDIEARTFGEIMVSPDGLAFIIEGKSYYNLEENQLDAIVRNSNGDIQGIRLTDISTGKQLTWSYNEAGEEFQEHNEQTNAIVDSLAYTILLQTFAIRADQSKTPAEVREELDVRSTAISEDAAVRQKFEENTETTLTEKELAANNFSKTAGLTDDQLRVQIETLKADLEEIQSVLNELRGEALTAGFTAEEYVADPLVASNIEKKRATIKLLQSKVNVLNSRKAEIKADVLSGTELTANNVDEALSTTEEDLILAGLEEEIKKFEDDMAPLEELANTYKDIVSGKYEGQDVAAAAVSLKDINKKIGVIKAKVTKRKNKINEVNAKRQLEELRQNRDAAERAGQPIEGQEPETKDINSGTTTQGEGLAPISTSALDLITQQLGMAAEVAREQEQKNQQATTPINELDQPKPTTGVAPTVVTSDPVVRTAGETDVRLAKGEFLTNQENKVIVNEDFMPIPSDNITQTIDGVPIVVDPGVLGMPEFAAAGSTVTFEVREDSDWWKGESPNIPETEHWKRVPIYVTAINPTTGEKVYVSLLQVSNPSLATGEQGLNREDIFNLYKQGLTPTAKVITKRYNSSNFSNARTSEGDVVFFPFQPDASMPTIMYVGFKKGTGKVLRMATPGDNPIPNIEQVNFDLTNLTPGQIVFPVKDPNGNPTMVVGTTRNVTPEVATAVIDSIKNAETPDATALTNLVGVSIFISGAFHGQYDMGNQVDEDIIEMRQVEGNNFMFVETLMNGTQLVTFFSQSANSLVRTNMSELQAALKGAAPRFSYVELGLNDKGYPAVLPTPNEGANRDNVANALAADFKQAMLNKKLQVSETLLASNEPFVSPIDNTTYPTYYEFLTSDTALSTNREDGIGSQAILAADVVTNNHGSVFYDVGLKLGNISTVEKPVQVEEDLQAKQVALPAIPAAVAPIAPVATISGPTAEETVVEITGPESTSGFAELLGQIKPSTPVAIAADAVDVTSTEYLLSRSSNISKEEKEDIARQQAAKEAQKEPDLAQRIQDECIGNQTTKGK